MKRPRAMRRFASALAIVTALSAAYVVSCSLRNFDDIPFPGDDASAHLDTGAPNDAHLFDTGNDADGGLVDAAATCDADLASEPRNCGSCGHDCLRGDCQQGKCQPFMLSDAAGTLSVTTSGGIVFWTESNPYRVVGAPTDGGAARISATFNTQVNFIAAYGGVVSIVDFWGRVYRCPASLVNCDISPPIFVGTQEGGRAVAADDGGTYWAAQSITDAGTSIRRFDPNGDAGVVEIGHMPTSHYVSALAVDDTFVYWPSPSAPSQVWRTRKDGTGPAGGEVIASGLTNPYGVAVDGTRLYWADIVDGVRAMNKATDASVSLVSNRRTYLLAIDPNNFYWTDTLPDGGVFGCAFSGGCVATLRAYATGESYPAAIAVDDKSIFWTRFPPGGAAGGVMQVVK